MLGVTIAILGWIGLEAIAILGWSPSLYWVGAHRYIGLEAIDILGWRPSL